MTSPKKPDNVVFNAETQKYDAALKPYATSLGAPVIIPTDTVAWKNRSINKINHKVTAKFLELKAEYENMIQEFEYNKLIFNAKFSLLFILMAEYILPNDPSPIFFSGLYFEKNILFSIPFIFEKFDFYF